MPLFTRDFISCRAKPFALHLYNDPVMLTCGHVFCRSCCLDLASISKDQSMVCPTCLTRISFDNINRFVTNLTSHGTLAAMVKQFLREDKMAHRICNSCQTSPVDDHTKKICNKCESDIEDMKAKIKQTMRACEEELLSNEQTVSLEIIRDHANQLYERMDQRENELYQKIDQYRDKLVNILKAQQATNENNATKHQPIDIDAMCALVEPRLLALRNKENFLENISVENEIKRLHDAANRELCFLRDQSDTVPILTVPTKYPLNNMFGELIFVPYEFEPKVSSSPSDQSMLNSSGNESLQSIPPKSPMWSVVLEAIPTHICIYPFGRSTLTFSCSSNGIISLLTYISPVTYDSPRYIRSFNLFPDENCIHVQSFTVFNRYMLVHVQQKYDNGTLYFFTHNGILEHEPVHLCDPISQYLADENRLWAIDSRKRTIFSHAQPLSTNDISIALSKRDHFVTFDDKSDFIPFRIAISQQFLAVLSTDSQQIFIYNKTSGERIFTSHFSAGTNTNIRDMKLFPRDDSLLLRFDWISDGYLRRSLFIHFNRKNQSVGRIEGKHCLGFVIGPNKEILVGFNLRTGIIRCYI